MKNWLALCDANVELQKKVAVYQRNKRKNRILQRKLNFLINQAKLEGFNVCERHPEQLGSVLRCLHDKCHAVVCRECSHEKSCNECKLLHGKCKDCETIVCPEVDMQCALCDEFVCAVHFWSHEC